VSTHWNVAPDAMLACDPPTVALFDLATPPAIGAAGAVLVWLDPQVEDALAGQ
jgi:hypothetical protein